MSAGLYAERVARGAALLDEKRPGWFRAVDLDGLELSSCEACVLGQLFGGYVAGTWALFAEDGRPGQDAVDCGFSLSWWEADELRKRYGDDNELIYGWLTEAWHAAVHARLSAA